MQCFFATGPGAALHGRMKGDMLLVEAGNVFTKGMVDKPQVVELLRQKASAMLGRPVGVKIVLQGHGFSEGNDKLDELLRFGAEHDDVINIQK